MNRNTLSIIIAYATMCLIWGTTWLAVKFGLHDIPVLTAVGLRFLIAGLILAGIAIVRGELFPLRSLPWNVILVQAVLLFGIDFVLVYWAESKVDSGVVSVLFSVVPFFTFAFGRLLIGERITTRTFVGAILAFAGVAFISLTGALGGSPICAIAAIVAAAACAFANVYAKSKGAFPPLRTLPAAMSLSGATLLALGLRFEHTNWHAAFALNSVLALAYLSIFGSGIAFGCVMWLLQRLPAGTVGLAPLSFPVIALVTGAMLGGEIINKHELFGAALVLGGLTMAVVPSSRKMSTMAPKRLAARVLD
jgi:drug/metabolite transporter (DMT)-like permease